ncbi:MAG: HEPN domain-containing protein [Deltaproteobacteria bacterium]|nr:HEPN domain-containing protein [Deltaproteobacteria bacterium]
MAEELEIIEGYRKRAREELEASRLALDGRFYAASISRGYYAVYYAMCALLSEKGIVTKSHRQTGIEFRKNFVKTGTVERKYSDILDKLFTIRMESDYDAIPNIDERLAKKLLQDAHDFVERMLQL